LEATIGRDKPSVLKRQPTVSQLKIELQKNLQYNAQGITQGNSPSRVRGKTLERQATRPQHSLEQTYGLGVSDPKKEKYGYRFSGIAPARTIELEQAQRREERRIA